MEDGVEMATVYAFSSENWNRDRSEVDTLMTIFAKYAETMKVESLKNNVRVKILSTGMLSVARKVESEEELCITDLTSAPFSYYVDFDRLPFQVQHSVRELEQATEKCNGFLLNICLSYGARAEIVGACKSIVSELLSKTKNRDDELVLDKENDAPCENICSTSNSNNSSPRRSKRISGNGSSASAAATVAVVNSNKGKGRRSDDSEVLRNLNTTSYSGSSSGAAAASHGSEKTTRDCQSVVRRDASSGTVLIPNEVEAAITEEILSQHMTTCDIPGTMTNSMPRPDTDSR
jgi:hypothetical protein